EREEPVGHGVEPLAAEPYEQTPADLQRALTHEVLPFLVAKRLEVGAVEAANLDLGRGPVTHDRRKRIRAKARDCLRESEPDIDAQEHEPSSVRFCEKVRGTESNARRTCPLCACASPALGASGFREAVECEPPRSIAVPVQSG